MDPLPHVSLAVAAPIALLCLAIGLRAGSAIARRRCRALSRELADRELALLDARRAIADATRAAALEGRRSAALRLALERAGLARSRVRTVERTLEAERRRHLRELADARLELVRSRDTARRAAALARRATSRLRRPMRVPDPAGPPGRRDAVTRVSERDSARLSRLVPSNEPRRSDAVRNLPLDTAPWRRGPPTPPERPSGV